MNTAKDILSPDAFESIDFLAEIFKSVGPNIVSQAGKVDHIDKSDGSPVTKVDVDTENAIRSAFSTKFPDIAIYGEESGYSNDLPELYWLIDPIDGTESFINNIPAYTTMGILIHKNQAVASIINNPSSNELFVARLGMGATKDSKPFKINNLPPTKIIMCKSALIDDLKEIFAETDLKIERSPQGVGHGFVLVLNNSSDARLQIKGSGYLHDYAPGALLIKEAGGDLIPILEDTYTYRTRSFIACHPAISELMRDKLQQIRNLEDPKNTAF